MPEPESDPQGFAMIPRWLLYSAEVTGPAKLTYAILASHADRYGACWPSHPTIARESGLSVSTVQRSITELVNLGAVVKGQRSRSSGARSSNRYTIAVQLPTLVD
jgi:hypothetical protein